MSLAVRTVRATAWNLFRLLVGVLGSIVVSVLVARQLGPERMGLYSYAFWVLSVLALLANVGLPDTLTRYLAHDVGSGKRRDARELFDRLLRQQLLSIAVFTIVGICLLWVFARTSSLARLVVAASIYICFLAAQQFFTAALAAFYRFDLIARISITVTLVQVGLVWFVTYRDGEIAAILLAVTLSLLPGVALGLRYTNRLLMDYPPSAQPIVEEGTGATKERSRRIRSFLWVASYAVILDMIVWQRSEVFFLARWSSLSDLGYYSIAFGLTGAVAMVLASFTDVLFPLYSSVAGAGDARRLAALFEKSFRYLQMATAPACLFLLAMASPIVRLAYGPVYDPVVPLFQVFMIGLSVTVIGGICVPVILATENQAFIARYGTGIALLNIVLDFMLIRRFGAMGAVFANSIAQVLAIGLSVNFVTKIIPARVPFRRLGMFYVCAGLCSIPLHIVGSDIHITSLLLLAVVCFGLYVVCLAALGEITLYELSLLQRFLIGQKRL